MNKDSVSALLARLLGRFWVHPLLASEICGLIAASGIERSFFALLSARLEILSRLGTGVTALKEFELIGGTLYSMHLSGSGFNIRVLFSFLPNRQPVLLIAFSERAGKRKTDYTEKIPSAKSRLDEMRRQYENEAYKL